MKKIIPISVIISLIISVAVLATFYYFMPLFPANNIGNGMFGATVTELVGTYTMSDFPTTYNVNLNALNDNKIEMATSSVDSITTLSNLVTVATIGTGVWNGTAIGVGYNGTGTTTPTAKQIMIGNGASGLQVIGFGTNGQFLTSGGVAALPSWSTSAINQATNYTWTGDSSWSGTSDFTGDVTIASSSIAQLNLNGYDANDLVGLNDASLLHTHNTSTINSTTSTNDTATKSEVEGTGTYTLDIAVGFVPQRIKMHLKLTAQVNPATAHYARIEGIFEGDLDEGNFIFIYDSVGDSTDSATLNDNLFGQTKQTTSVTYPAITATRTGSITVTITDISASGNNVRITYVVSGVNGGGGGIGDGNWDILVDVNNLYASN